MGKRQVDVVIVLLALFMLLFVAGCAPIEDLRGLSQAYTSVDVMVRSEPAGATIIIDGATYGRTPLLLKLQPGSHTLTLVKKSCVEHTETFNAPAKSITRKSITLLGCAQEPFCADSDNGPNLFAKGNVTAYDGSVAVQHADSCDRNIINEWVCRGLTPTMVFAPCYYGCVDGACRQNGPTPVNTLCSDSDGGRNYLAYGVVTWIASDGIQRVFNDTCRAYNILEEGYCQNDRFYSEQRVCYTCSNGVCSSLPQSDSCYDADFGINETVASNISGYLQTLGPYFMSDYCVNGSIAMEYYCNGNYPANTTRNCPLGCSQYRCKPQAPSCVDSDGSNRSVKGNVTVIDSGSISVWHDQCAGPLAVTEYGCGSSNQSTSATLQCMAGEVCEDGACVAATVYCTETDAGDDQFVNGTLQTNHGGVVLFASDNCTSPTNLSEWYCATPNGPAVNKNYTCAFNCSNNRCNPDPEGCQGVCLEIVPLEMNYSIPRISFRIFNNGTQAANFTSYLGGNTEISSLRNASGSISYYSPRPPTGYIIGPKEYSSIIFNYTSGSFSALGVLNTEAFVTIEVYKPPYQTLNNSMRVPATGAQCFGSCAGSSFANLSGMIRNSTGQAVVGATVNVSITGINQSASTNSSGGYRILNQPTGTSAIQVLATGYAANTSTTLLTAGENVRDFIIYRVGGEGGSQTGTVTITANAAGAAVYVDNAYIGSVSSVSPYIFSSPIATGTHTIRVSATGFGDYTTTVTLTTGQVVAVTATLSCASGSTLCNGKCCSPSELYCTDSDFGYNRTSQGTVTVQNSTQVISSHTDFCEGSQSTEYTCIGSNWYESGYDCTYISPSYKCSMGACVDFSQAKTSCVDSDSSNLEIYGNVSGTFVGGATYSVNDFCNWTSANPGVPTAQEWTCVGNTPTLVATSCTGNDGCFHNLCSVCWDNDKGQNRFIATDTEELINRGFGGVSLHPDQCVGGTTSLYGPQVLEFYCPTIHAYASVSLSCMNGCVFGACRNESPSHPTCTDTDGGPNFMQSGTVTGPTGAIFTDACPNGNGNVNITEWYCDTEFQPKNFTYQCNYVNAAYTCNAGRCS